LAASAALPGVARSGSAGDALSLGFVTAFLSVVVCLPLAALLWASAGGDFWSTVTGSEALAALRLTLLLAAAAALLNAVLGTVTAWVLVRDDFRGKALVTAVIDLPFALPTIVAGLVLLALYGPQSPVGVDVAFTRTAILLALLFVTLPFVVRTVQPVLLELDAELEDAARSLGAGERAVFRPIGHPAMLPRLRSGVPRAFARAVGEIGALVIISGNVPFKTEAASVFVFNRIQTGDRQGAAAVAVVLLAISFAVLLAVGALRRLATRHERG
jgi:sulfate transport system permease protein